MKTNRSRDSLWMLQRSWQWPNMTMWRAFSFMEPLLVFLKLIYREPLLLLFWSQLRTPSPVTTVQKIAKSFEWMGGVWSGLNQQSCNDDCYISCTEQHFMVVPSESLINQHWVSWMSSVQWVFIARLHFCVAGFSCNTEIVHGYIF